MNIRRRVPLLETLVLVLALGLGALALRRLGVGSARVLFGLCAVAGALGLATALGTRPSAASAVPIEVRPRAGYVSSGACRSCHPAEWQSWHESYHRSMTEAATSASLRAPWDEVLEWRGRTHTLFRRGDELWARLPDPDRASALARQDRPLDGVPDVDRRVVMTTGSHHYQAYWVPGARGNELWQLPFVYHFESQRFIPRHDAFLQPESDPMHVARWNSNCIQCHAVAGEPRHDLASDRFESRAVELGIACEACHGPGAEHVARERDPWVRQGDRQALSERPPAADRRAGGPADANERAIVNPARLDARRASEVCGQCHSYFLPRDANAWWTSGFAASYRPGDDWQAARRLIELEPGSPSPDPELSASLDSLFYPDGTIRVGGREWNGLAASACFREGQGDRQLACTSCHRMHGGSRDDQLDGAGESNAACAGCHAGYGSDHSRHAEGSSGDQCVNCHMPRTTYALFKSIRSHRITRPEVDRDPGARLNACNLCHQDRSLDWTEQQLAARAPHSAPAPAGSDEASTESALAVALLSGDAANRVIAAAELGAPEARAVSGSGWQAQLLAEALDDPYAAVRFVAQRSLRRFPGLGALEYDFVAAPEQRRASLEWARQRAALEPVRLSAHASVPPLPLDERGRIRRDVIERLTSARDSRPIRIAE
ncbi:MAG TPA: cytochrome c3 family protein [Polyangiaceae bacterium]|nr:cytochrome c3 family protein [Polyangiaceae bacterium]